MSTSTAKGMWPPLPYAEWRETLDTLHMWTQIVGKVKLKLSPWTNHSWHVTLLVTPYGLTTGSIASPEGSFDISFDFVHHRLKIHCDSGESREFDLQPMTVVAFHDKLFAALGEVGIEVSIYEKPNEVPDATPFTRDRTHHSYDAEAVSRFHQALIHSDRILKEFRAAFIGKCSPVHFFWGSFDLAVTRFSGREAPEHPGGIPNLPDWITREAYSHEVSSAGFWPGGPMLPEAVYYSYAYPAPEGYGNAKIRPSAAYFHPELREFVLPYEAVRGADDPNKALLEFLQSTYEAAADLGRWDRRALERSAPPGARLVK